MGWKLRVTLKSDATFARGEALPGVVDQEVEHDPTTGLPFIRGRILKGLLVEECANILYSLAQANSSAARGMHRVAEFLFGSPGSTDLSQGALHVGPALLPQELRSAVKEAVDKGDLRPDEVLESLTAVRRQTSVDSETGAPEEGSLRATRVVLRGTEFEAELEFTRPFAEGKGSETDRSSAQGSVPAPGEEESLALLAACVLAVRRGGLGRTRGRGRLEMRLEEDGRDVTLSYFEDFKKACEGPKNGDTDVQGGAA